MSDYYASSISRELRPNERLLWQGRPRGGIRLRGSDLYVIPFSLFWCSLVFSAAASSFLGPKKNPVAGLPLILFVAMGLYLLLGRFVVDALRRKNTAYALTSRRAIIVLDFFGRRVQSINLQTIPDVSLTEKSDGSGTITFGATQALSWGRNNSWTFGSAQPAFEMIEDVRRVSDLVNNARSG